jgi:hypothetical protein
MTNMLLAPQHPECGFIATSGTAYAAFLEIVKNSKALEESVIMFLLHPHDYFP